MRRAAALAVLLAACGEAPAPLPRPDVILVSIDSLRADHLGCYGYARDTSPTLDRLASEGVRFARAVSTTSWTLPAHAAMFTGLYDTAHGLVDNGLALAPERETLAELLRARGYRTAGFYGGPYLHPVYGLDQGFEHYESCMGAVPADLSGDELRAEAEADDARAHADVTGPRTVEAVTRYLATAREEPLFLFVHLWDVHYDYVPPPEYVERYDPGYDGPVDGVDIMRDESVRADMPARDREHLVALYDGEVRFTDDVLSDILAAFDDRRGLDDALLVVTADHGEEFFEHGGKGHQRTLYEEVVRVPLVVRWPAGLKGGRVVPDLVSLVDLPPTVLTLTGARERPAVQGRDLTPLLLGDALPPEPALLELLVGRLDARALRTDDAKVVDPGLGYPPYAYDLARDPGETRQLPIAPGALAEGLDALRALVDDSRRRADGARAPAVEISGDLQRRLRALGYTEDR